ncbi:hypothetical protein KUCAC02_037728, partial [Chaenocephalus aceratus]
PELPGGNEHTTGGLNSNVCLTTTFETYGGKAGSNRLPNRIIALLLWRITHSDAAEHHHQLWDAYFGDILFPSRGRTMADDDILFEDVYELCEVIG